MRFSDKPVSDKSGLNIIKYYIIVIYLIIIIIIITNEKMMIRKYMNMLNIRVIIEIDICSQDIGTKAV